MVPTVDEMKKTIPVFGIFGGKMSDIYKTVQRCHLGSSDDIYHSFWIFINHIYQTV